MNATGEPTLLDRAWRAADRALDAVQLAQIDLAEGNAPDATARLQEANEAAQSARLLLADAGAATVDAPARAEVPLHLLDTPAARRLLAALADAERCAAEVDAERGWTLPDGTGCGLTDVVGDVRERLRQQVEGPRGRE